MRAILKRKVKSGLSRSKKSTQSKIKPRSLSSYKKELDRVFSLYIRAKYPKVCFTCRRTGKTLQCGHFVPRIYLPTRWEEMNCRPQCVGCNIWGRGQLLDFEENLIEEIGEVKVKFLKEIRNQVWKLTPEWYIQKINEFKQKLHELENA